MDSVFGRLRRMLGLVWCRIVTGDGLLLDGIGRKGTGGARTRIVDEHGYRKWIYGRISR